MNSSVSSTKVPEIYYYSQSVIYNFYWGAVCSVLIRIPFIFDPLFVNPHSERNVFTGLVIAALIEWKLIVTSVIKMIDPPAILNGIIPAETL